MSDIIKTQRSLARKAPITQLHQFEHLPADLSRGVDTCAAVNHVPTLEHAYCRNRWLDQEGI